MKKIIVAGIFFFITAFTISGQIIDQPIAEVNLHKREVIWLKKFKKQVETVEENQLGGQSTTQEQRLELLNTLIDQKLILQTAAKEGFVVTQDELDKGIATYMNSLSMQYGRQITRAQLVEQLNVQGQTWDSFVDEIKNQLSLEKYIMEKKREFIKTKLDEARKKITEKQIKDVYNTYATQFSNPAMRKIKHIYISTQNADAAGKEEARKEAELVYRKLKSGGADFETMAEEHSDESGSKYAGGDVGWVLRVQDPRYDSKFIKKVFDLDVGELSTVFESSGGYHIVKVTAERDPRVPGLNDPVLPIPGSDITVKEQIKNLLLQQEQTAIIQQVSNDIVDELRGKADIRIYEDRLDW
ncbi:MAG: peptidylprolyl isomerase [Spirochaetia bacterium]